MKNTSQNFHIHRSQGLQGTIQVPGDKSISHRSVMLGSIAEGLTKISGFLEGEDCLATIAAFRAMGVKIEGPDAGNVRIHGVGLQGLKKPTHPLDLGNSGTSIRLLCGLLAGQTFDTNLTGDSSLQKRPMGRVVNPLLKMGADIRMSTAQTPPLYIKGQQKLHGIRYEMPVASAQVKSCLLLAGLYAESITTIIEPARSRDHTERMLQGFGVKLNINNNEIAIQGGQKLKGVPIQVPGDISSAAFFLVAASIVPNSKITLQNVGINPTRTGILTILKLMGADFNIHHRREICGEPVADITIQSAQLHGIEIPPSMIPLAIDEFPAIFIAAAVATGKTILKGAKELRVKESDRLYTMASGLKTLGIECEELEDGMIIHGGKFHSGEINSHSDHRVAMAFSIAGLITDEIKVYDCNNVKTSFPNFVTLANSLGSNIKIS